MQNISRIKRAFKLRIINEELAGKYYIKGRRGTRYSIAIDRSLVTLPRAFHFEK